MIEWRGPSPYYFVRVPHETSAEINDVSALVSYGWGVIPVSATVGRTTWNTSLFPREGQYLVPIKNVVRRGERIELAQIVAVSLTLQLSHERF